MQILSTLRVAWPGQETRAGGEWSGRYTGRNPLGEQQSLMWTGPNRTPVVDAVAGIAGALDALFTWDAAESYSCRIVSWERLLLNTAAFLGRGRHGFGLVQRREHAARLSCVNRLLEPRATRRRRSPRQSQAVRVASEANQLSNEH